jgi:hypothetical protein
LDDFEDMRVNAKEPSIMREIDKIEKDKEVAELRDRYGSGVCVCVCVVVTRDALY